jgi:hypothetical protein
MIYDELLANAPAHDTPEFLEYLEKNNVYVYGDDEWMVIENCKYHRPDRKWYTAFLRDNVRPDLHLLDKHFGHLTWLKKSPKKQTVQRFHIHMYEE